MKILVKNDLYDISNRIKKFDSSYRAVYDVCTNKYQVYSTTLYGNIELIGWTPLSYVCTLPYDQLDVRSIQYLYDTSVDNLGNLLTMIDENNKGIEDYVNNKVKDQTLNLVEDKLRQLS